MSWLLSLYSQYAYKDVLLPGTDNADHVLDLSAELFGLPADIRLYMEVLGGRWRFLEDPGVYRVSSAADHSDHCGRELQNGDILAVSTEGTDRVFILVRTVEHAFSVYSKIALSNVSTLSIGADPDNDIQYSFNNLITHHQHAVIENRGGIFVLRDQSANGTFVNARRISGGSCQLVFGDTINIYGLKMVFLGEMLAIDSLAEGLRINNRSLTLYKQQAGYAAASRRREEKKKEELFHRSPRILPKIETEPVEIEAAPAEKESNALPTFMAIGPSMTMALPMLAGSSLAIISAQQSGRGASIMMFTGAITAVLSAALGIFWALKNMSYQKKKNRADEVKRFETYSEYLIRCSNEIKSKYAHNAEALNRMYGPAESCAAYGRETIQLWNRNPRHEDFLRHRLGMGQVPFQVEIKVPKERFSMIDDSLNERPRMIKESFKYLTGVPVCVDLFAHKLVGLIGGENYRGCYPVVRDLVAQIAATNSYTDVKLAFVYDNRKGDAEDHWGFARWLPHVWSEDGKVRYVAADRSGAGDVFYEIANVLRFRAEEEAANRHIEGVPKPYYILIVEDPELLEGELLAKYVYDNGINFGLTTILMVRRYDELPNACEYIIENTENYQGEYGVTDGVDERVPIAFDNVSYASMETFARRLAGIRVKEEESGGEIPNALSFFDMYNVSRPDELGVLERWKKNRTYESMKALVGQKAGGANCYLDVHEKYHGPHGLVAGTTGSGKSETLQTYMLSLAINYSPDDIGFFIIDYKGGGMANLFNGLPHMIGQISNLSGNQVRRAMVSIKSENKRRQRIFNEHGVNNINLYTRLYKNNEADIPVPHLFIIIDEFAELKREEPDFMKELISVAQVGRSLGVHLILATQKPSGTVDDNIWSNSKFRLCLRVQDRQDSMDMLHKADAAYITQAGRCYMQVGNDELYELFQSGWSGAVYDEGGSVQTEIARMLTDGGKAAIVGSHAQIKRKEELRNGWIRSLIGMIDEGLARMGCDIVTAAADRELREQLTGYFFSIAEREQTEYARSEYNEQRVGDLLDAYAKCISEGSASVEAIVHRAYAMKKKLPEKKEKTQLDAVVEYLAEVAAKNGYDHDLQLWLPVLPSEMYLDELPGYGDRIFDGEKWPEPARKFTLETPIGLYDDPENQAQDTLMLDIADGGNLAVVGTVMTGKTGFLTSCVYSLSHRYSPEEVNFYILDFSSKIFGAFEQLPHTGGVMFEDDLEKISKFFTFLDAMIQERKKLFSGGNYSQYVQKNGRVVPAVVIVIDNYGGFRAKTENRYDERIQALMKDSVSYGIFFAVSAAGFSMTEIPGRLMDMYRNIYTLELSDRMGYLEAMRCMHLDVMPEVGVHGRGLAKVGDRILEYQTALSLRAEDDFRRGELIAEESLKLREAWHGKRAKQIPTIPDEPVWKEFSELDDVIAMAAEGKRLPVGYDSVSAAVYGVDLRNCYTYIVSGKSHSGKTNVMKDMIAAAGMTDSLLTVIDLKGELRRVAESSGARYISDKDGIFDFFDNELIPDFMSRNRDKAACAEQGCTDDEIYGKMQSHKKRMVMIGDMKDFLKAADIPGDQKSLTMTLANLFEKGALHNIYWFGAVGVEQVPELMGLMSWQAFAKEKNGVWLGGNVSDQRLFSFEHLPYKEQTKKRKPGVGMLPTHENDDCIAVVYPLYRQV
ncbi:MAG: type VII secretion protein EssC [Lachnospiraceae bacterium]|nr:type VII secretion protein EssC [Lachnospiraceae bacterium]